MVTVAEMPTICTKTFLFEVSHEKVGDLEQFYASGAENSHSINLEELKYLCDNLPNQNNLSTIWKKKDQILKIVPVLTIIARSIVFTKGINEMYREILKKCSPAVRDSFTIVQAVTPFFAKLLEHLKELCEQTYETSGAYDNMVVCEHETYETSGAEGNMIIDLHKARQTQMNQFEVDLRRFKHDLSVTEDKIRNFIENIETNKCVHEENLQDIEILLRQVERNCGNQLAQNKELIGKLNKLNQIDINHQNISRVVKRMKRTAEHTIDQEQQQCPCCVIRHMSREGRQTPDSTQFECLCCKCLSEKILNDIMDIETALKNHVQELPVENLGLLIQFLGKNYHLNTIK